MLVHAHLVDREPERSKRGWLQDFGFSLKRFLQASFAVQCYLHFSIEQVSTRSVGARRYVGVTRSEWASVSDETEMAHPRLKLKNDPYSIAHLGTSSVFLPLYLASWHHGIDFSATCGYPAVKLATIEQLVPDIVAFTHDSYYDVV